MTGTPSTLVRGTPTEIVNKLADEMIVGLRREHDRPFSGLTYGSIEAVQKLREQICAALVPHEQPLKQES